MSPFSFPWPLGNGFPSAFLNELKGSINHTNHAAVSDERQRIMSWSTDDVASHVRSIGCADQAKIFSEQVRLFTLFFALSVAQEQIALIAILVTLIAVYENFSSFSVCRELSELIGVAPVCIPKKNKAHDTCYNISNNFYI